MDTDHQQVKTKYLNHIIEVDVGMKPLLEALWKRRIYTVLSCQENQPGITWIEFLSPNDANKFINLAHKLSNEAMQNRILRFGHEEDWTYDLIPELNEDDTEITFYTSVRFPIRDLETLTKLLNCP